MTRVYAHNKRSHEWAEEKVKKMVHPELQEVFEVEVHDVLTDVYQLISKGLSQELVQFSVVSPSGQSFLSRCTGI